MLMQMNINYEASHALCLMKYALNHPWKFKYRHTAFMSGFCQASSTVLTALVCYSVIISSKDILELAKDFTALMIIIDFDNYFAHTSSDDITKEIIDNSKEDGDKSMYVNFFKVETTTSINARKNGNAKLEEPEDEANELINRRIEHKNKYPRNNFCCKTKKLVVRPKKIAITWGKRYSQFGCCNFLLFLVYRLLRVLFVSFWFYYLPVIFVVISNLAPVKIYWDKIEGCDKFVAQDCVGSSSVSTECLKLCRAYSDDLEAFNGTPKYPENF